MIGQAIGEMTATNHGKVAFPQIAGMTETEITEEAVTTACVTENETIELATPRAMVDETEEMGETTTTEMTTEGE